MGLVKCLMCLLLLTSINQGCSNHNKKALSDNHIADSTFSVQELYLLSQLNGEDTLLSRKDSVDAIRECMVEITGAQLEFPECMDKFPNSYEYTSKEDYLYKQYKYALKVFNDNNVLSFKERVKAKQKRDNDLYESL